MRLDHAVILVPDLASGIDQFKGLGFTVLPGGEHVGGDTHNALVCFGDGSYLELLAFIHARSTAHRWERFRPYPGAIDFCLGCPNVAAAVAGLRERGVEYSLLGEAGRIRTDGVRLRWRTGLAPVDGRGLPFLIEDVTPRDLRVAAGEAARHPNGALGIAGIDVLAGDEAAARAGFAGVLGPAPDSAHPLRYVSGSVTVRVGAPDPDSRDADLLAIRGAGPVRIHIRMAHDQLLAI